MTTNANAQTFFIAKPALHTTDRVADVAYPIPAEVRDGIKNNVIYHYNVMAQCLSIVGMSDADFKARMADKTKRYQLCQMAKMLAKDREEEVVRSAARDTAYERVAEALAALGLDAAAELGSPPDMSVTPRLATLEQEQLSRFQRRA